jgi:hypothetical protein
MLKHILNSIVMALTIGAASLVTMAYMIDGAPMMAAAMLASPFLN